MVASGFDGADALMDTPRVQARGPTEYAGPLFEIYRKSFLALNINVDFVADEVDGTSQFFQIF